MATRIFEGYNFFRPWIRERTILSLTALAGGGQAGATLCKAAINTFSTVATNLDSAILPGTQFNNSIAGNNRYTARGAALTIINLSTRTLNLFPAVGEQIDNLGANNPIALQANSIAYLTANGPGTWFSSYGGFGGASASAQTTTASPVGTTSSVMVMMGLATLITPVSTGRLLITISGIVAQNTTTDGAKYQISTGTGAAPANGAALTGTQIGSNPSVTSFVTSELAIPFSTTAIQTGLARGTQVWIDLALAAITAGTASVSQVSVSAMEF